VSAIGTSGASGTDSSGPTRTGLQSPIHDYYQYLYCTFAAPLGVSPGYFTTPGDPRTFGLMAAARF
jgi:hypothetical protein